MKTGLSLEDHISMDKPKNKKARKVSIVISEEEIEKNIGPINISIIVTHSNVKIKASNKQGKEIKFQFN